MNSHTGALFRGTPTSFQEAHPQTEWSLNLELATREETGKPRLHFHFVLITLSKSQKGTKIRYVQEYLYKFYYNPSTLSQQFAGRVNSSRRVGHGCHLYFQGPKKFKLTLLCSPGEAVLAQICRPKFHSPKFHSDLGTSSACSTASTRTTTGTARSHSCGRRPGDSA